MSGTPAPAGSVNDQSYRAILDYLNRRGHSKAAAALTADLAAATSGTGSVEGGGKSVGLDDFADRNAPSQPRTPGATPAPSGGAAGAAARRRPDQQVAGGQLLADPPSWEKGYEGLRNFVENSLDIHRPELHPLLLPLFVHSYLDLVLVGYREAADQFLSRFAPDHSPLYPSIVRLLSSIRLANHVSESEEATRWRQERYHVRLSERGWGLLLGWLQGGGLQGREEGTEARGRDRVLAIINERVKVDAVPGPPSRIPSFYGLTSEVTLSSTTGTSQPNYSAESGAAQLKLGPAHVDPKLAREVQRAVRDDDGINQPLPAVGAPEVPVGAEGGEPIAVDFADEKRGDEQGGDAEGTEKKAGLPELISPYPAELPPYPSTLRTIDVMREVEKVREARKRIKLGAEAYTESGPLVEKGKEKRGERGEGAAKPSVCLFTIHDAGESLITSTFSDDSTLLACGFSESYIRLWSLKNGQGLRGLRMDFDSDEITDANDLRKLRQPANPTSRKLIGHSGPVYSLSFDPVPGASGPPRYLLSASQDSTVRLWSLDTFSCLVAYRGHREPVWCVEWGPRGVYFATGSRDRTARLWSSDKTTALRIFAGHLSDVNCLRFHPNSLYLATGSSDRTCRLWDVQKGTCVRVFVGHRGSVQAVDISPDGRWLASAAEDLTINLWDLASGRKVKTMTGHTSSIHSLSFSAESTVLISGSADCTVRVWDVLAPADEDDLAATTGASGIKGAMGGVKRTSLKEVREKAHKQAGFAGDAGGAGGEGKSGVGKLGALSSSQDRRGSADLLATLATKRTPILEVKFTQRNLGLAAGSMQESG